jgi:hypothetical protein
MKKLFFMVPLFLLGITTAFSQTKPITQMVLDAHNGKGIEQLSLFATEIGDIAEFRDVQAGVGKATILYWDAARVAQVRARSNSAISLVLPTNEGKLVLDLVPAKNFSDDFAVHHAENGTVAQVDRGTHFWGIVRGDKHSLASISVFDNEVVGSIGTDRGNIVIGAIKGDDLQTHILYNDRDLKAQSGFACLTDEEKHQIGEKHIGTGHPETGPSNCVRMFIETDFTLFQNKGSVANVTSYMTGVFSQVSAMYTNEQINLVLHNLFVWSSTDPYTGPSASNYLDQFRIAKNGVFNGDLAHLVGIHGLGGVAYLDVLCNGLYSVGYSSINATYNNVPVYSWTIMVLTHEIGHNLGSPHTHACAWNGNNTAIDGCGPTAGYSEGCTAAVPTGGGTVMSYCHLLSTGINLSLGFGPQPGNLIRNETYNAPCLAACGGGGGTCTFNTYNSNNFESGFGIWTDGGTDCIRTSNNTYANSPSFSIQLRDNTNTSVTTTTNQNLSAYTKIKVDFTYVSVSFENGEDFWLQISTNGGTSYTTKATFVAGTNFANGIREFESIEITGPFTSNTRIRFRADASDDDDQVYIDDVVISACTQQFDDGSTEERTDWVELTNEDNNRAVLSDVVAAPIPASEQLQVIFGAEAEMPVRIALTDLTGRIVGTVHTTAMRGQNALQIPVSHLPNGLYLLEILGGESQHVKKVVVRH